MNMRVIFTVSGVLTESHTGPTTEFITGLIRNLAVSRQDWKLIARNNLVLYNSEINEKFLSESNAPFVEKKQDAMYFTSFIHKDPLLTDGTVMIGNGEQFGFRIEYDLTSVEYTCIQVLPDKTLVCYSDMDRALRYFRPSESCVAEVI